MADNLAGITVSQSIATSVTNAADFIAEEVSVRGYTPNNTKVQLDDINYPSLLEIRPNLRGAPNETPFILTMVDSNFIPFGIRIGNDIVIGNIKFYPNPDSMIVNSSKIITRYNTMTRWVEEHWGDEIDTITFSGSSYAFLEDGSSGARTGITMSYRNQTAPYRFMGELNKFFRQNGCIYQGNSDYSEYVGSSNTQKKLTLISSNSSVTTPVEKFLTDPDNQRFVSGHPREGLIKERLYVSLAFDYIRFLGYFDTFDIIEDSSTPYRFTYSIVFKSEKTTFLLG